MQLSSGKALDLIFFFLGGFLDLEEENSHTQKLKSDIHLFIEEEKNLIQLFDSYWYSKILSLISTLWNRGQDSHLIWRISLLFLGIARWIQECESKIRTIKLEMKA